MFADSSSMLGFASDHLKVEWFPAGSFIVEQGEPADTLYLLLSGSVDVRREISGKLQAVASIQEGEFIGETGLATGERRNAHCIAATDCACFVMTHVADTAWKPHGASAVHDQVDAIADEIGSADLTMEVGHLVDKKVEALACHQTQYPIAPGMFPESMLTELLGVETFVQTWPLPHESHLQ